MLLAALLLMSGCATLDAAVERTESHAMVPPYESTRLGRIVSEDLERRPDESACVMLDKGPLALFQRGVLADYADRTIDVQTYIYADDDSGIVFMERLFHAAERGVRIRLLIDDNGLASDSSLPLILDEHPNIEVRIFNPFHVRARWSRPLQYLFEFRRLNRRMHNKVFIVDGTAVIAGGRNVGGDYFDQDKDENFTDLDVLVFGPVARAAASSFDEYWNSEYAVPTEAVPHSLDQSRRDELLATYRERVRKFDERRDTYEQVREEFVDALENRRIGMHWAKARFVADPPAKVDPAIDTGISPLVTALREEWSKSQREIMIASAYFVPGAEGTRSFAKKVQEGVAIKILTNSLASNDVAAVHAGYSKYRRDLLAAGVEIHEYQKFGETPKREDTPSSESSFHSKGMVFDRRTAWIGSFNLDPRSIELNTEVAIIVESSSLAGAIANRLEHDMAPERSWRVQLVPDDDGNGQLEWTGMRDDHEVVLRHEPDTSALKRFGVKLLRLMPGLDSLL